MLSRILFYMHNFGAPFIFSTNGSYKLMNGVQNAAEKPGRIRRLIGWPSMMLLNFVVIVTIATLGVGFGSYASVSNIILQVKSFGLFQACYQCKK